MTNRLLRYMSVCSRLQDATVSAYSFQETRRVGHTSLAAGIFMRGHFAITQHIYVHHCYTSNSYTPCARPRNFCISTSIQQTTYTRNEASKNRLLLTRCLCLLSLVRICSIYSRSRYAGVFLLLDVGLPQLLDRLFCLALGLCRLLCLRDVDGL